MVRGTPGSQGIQGAPGTPGSQGIQGAPGTPGKAGAPGTTGVGISSTRVDNSGNLFITLSNGTQQGPFMIRGAPGTAGVPDDTYMKQRTMWCADGTCRFPSRMSDALFAPGILSVRDRNGRITNISTLDITGARNEPDGTHVVRVNDLLTAKAISGNVLQVLNENNDPESISVIGHGTYKFRDEENGGSIPVLKIMGPGDLGSVNIKTLITDAFMSELIDTNNITVRGVNLYNEINNIKNELQQIKNRR